ncbi:MAG: hypothetical protein Kow0079_13230 [Vicingaceae bacterium]
MKGNIKISTIFIFLTIVLFSCKKDEVRKGCTDELAVNYDYLAKEDDGSCEYSDSIITIWNNGKPGYWGDALTGGFDVFGCYTGNTTIFTNADTIYTPADTIYQTNPVDTIYVPADTSIVGDTYLLADADTNGNYGLYITLQNYKDAMHFANGYLQFNVQLAPEAYGITNSFGVVIHGSNLGFSSASQCSGISQSLPVEISTATLDTNSFKTITIPLLDFKERTMRNINLVFGVKGSNGPVNKPVLIINNVKWYASEPE